MFKLLSHIRPPEFGVFNLAYSACLPSYSSIARLDLARLVLSCFLNPRKQVVWEYLENTLGVSQIRERVDESTEGEKRKKITKNNVLGFQSVLKHKSSPKRIILSHFLTSLMMRDGHFTIRIHQVNIGLTPFYVPGVQWRQWRVSPPLLPKKEPTRAAAVSDHRVFNVGLGHVETILFPRGNVGNKEVSLPHFPTDLSPLDTHPHQS